MPQICRVYQDAGDISTVSKLKEIQARTTHNVQNIQMERCYYIQYQGELSETEMNKLHWIFSTLFDSYPTTSTSMFDTASKNIVEVGPRLNFSTPFSTNAVSICQAIGLTNITRIESTTRYLLVAGDHIFSAQELDEISAGLCDRMTECRYAQPIESFDLQVNSEPVYEVDVMKHGRTALEKANKHLGLAFDDWDLDYYTDLFTNKIKRNPTSVECFDLAQSNSEHSRHWFFQGKLTVDGHAVDKSLFKMVKDTQQYSNQNNVIKFSDNSSGIEGAVVPCIHPQQPDTHTNITVQDTHKHIIFTAETHNFPTGVAPFAGATTGTGGRIRDIQGAGRGGCVVAGTAGYCFGNLNIPGYDLEWENKEFSYPNNFASPLQVAVGASNGASDYGNKFGEPVVCGFARSYGDLLPDGERKEWVKPIMFSAGIGTLDARHVKKEEPKKGMVIAKVGGPVYRIGVGGGAASSIQVQGDNTAELDFGAVQRGDAEMEQKMNRVIRACIERGSANPIASIHDQGAGGNGNVLKEICEPAGAVIYANEFTLGDPTISLLELWGAEYQESNAVLITADKQAELKRIAQRERCPVDFVGEITEDGKICLQAGGRPSNGSISSSDTNGTTNDHHQPAEMCVRHPVDLELQYVLGSMPRKEFQLERTASHLQPLHLDDVTVTDALHRVLRLPSVASKRYLTNKVDRSVTGLVAQQQCVGPLHTPLADVAVIALSYNDIVGSATAIGEQPIKGLVDAARGARMSVAEAITNIAFAQVSHLKDIKCSGNWMWAAKLAGEGALLYDACVAMCGLMRELGIAIDGGKDSLSMAARVQDQTVKAPGCLVISAYAKCPDITKTITPDFKCKNGKSSILHVDLSPCHKRLGGSALAQCYNQLGNRCPDVDDPSLLAAAFNTIQQLGKDSLVLSGHDISDGGAIVALLEMAFAGDCGFTVNINNTNATVLETLFSEELGFILEVESGVCASVVQQFVCAGVTCTEIGYTTAEKLITIRANESDVLSCTGMTALRDSWEETSYQLERLQADVSCVEQEATGLKHRHAPCYHLGFSVAEIPTRDQRLLSASQEPRVAVIREEGSNGDREMISAFHDAGFQVWDVHMQDLATADVDLQAFRGIAFVGGFSYADVCGSAKGWAATIKFNDTVRRQLTHFMERSDTFSLGVCNGCQLMALMGWVAPLAQQTPQEDNQGVFLAHNTSRRFESRFSSVKINTSPAVMLKGMQGSVLGVWVAHGEGRMQFKDDSVLNHVQANNLVALQYVDDTGNATETYPMNPNGSPHGIAALCSQDGRHLAMMPHPERATMMWQWPWVAPSVADVCPPSGSSPWAKMFANAFEFCC